MREQISDFQIKDMTLIYEKDETGVVGILFVSTAMVDKVITKKEYKLEPLIQVKLQTDDYPFGFSQGRTMRNSASVSKIYFVKQTVIPAEGTLNEIPTNNDIRQIITILKDDRGYLYEHIISAQENSNAIEVTTSIENKSGESINIEMLTSFTLGGITPFVDGIAEETMLFHQLKSTWSAEGRLVSTPIEDLQLEPSWQKYSANSFRFGQVGSMPVRGYVPIVGVTDLKSKVTWAVQLSHGSSWQLEAYRRDDALVLSGGLADREFGQWMKTLAPGEKFITPKAIMTVVEGDFTFAAQRLTENMRGYLTLTKQEEHLPIIFNEFCTTWGCPNEEMIERMVNILKNHGVEYFVIDAGWFSSYSFDEKVEIGEWRTNATRFPHGMKAVADKIKSMGMIPGIWFEFEINGRDSITFDWVERILTRDGYPITSGNRRFWDMRQEWTIDFLSEKVIEFLKNTGFQYIKVDYNDTIGVGCDGAESLGEGLRAQIEATLKFFAKIKKELPGIIIENCSSGGHRLVPSFLEMTTMSSFSDAHECDEIPIIAANMHRMILPRQNQIWAVLKNKNPLSMFYYQMASTLLGRCCISGDIETISKEQWEVVEEGFEFYREAAPIIDRGISKIYGSNIKSYRKPKGWQAVVRIGEDKTLVVFHTFHEVEKTISIPLDQTMKIDKIYARNGIKVMLSEKELIIQGLSQFDGVGVVLYERT